GQHDAPRRLIAREKACRVVQHSFAERVGVLRPDMVCPGQARVAAVADRAAADDLRHRARPLAEYPLVEAVDAGERLLQQRIGHRHQLSRIGSVRVTVVPSPGALSIAIRPPCRWTIARAIVSPIPPPGIACTRASAERHRRSNALERSSGAMPNPRSCTTQRTARPSCSALTLTGALFGV